MSERPIEWIDVDGAKNFPRTLEDAFPFDRCEYAMACENWCGTKFSLPMPAPARDSFMTLVKRWMKS